MPEHALVKNLYEHLSRYLSDKQVEFIKEAFVFAEEAHSGQKRKSGEPYIIHPIGVAQILCDLRMDSSTIVASLLHDVVEDTEITLEEIQKKYGANIAMLVDGVTKLNKIGYVSKEDQQLENYRRMFLAMAKDIRVILIKLADRLHNMRTLTSMTPAKQRIIAQETREIYVPLANRLGIYNMKWELEDLAFRYLEPESYYDLVEQVQQKREEREATIDSAIEELRVILNEAGIYCDIQGRPKGFFSIYRKMIRDDKSLNEIYDLLAIRVLVDSVMNCYAAIGLVHAKWPPIPTRFKDYIAMPKSNLYQSLHTTVMSSFGQPLEIQIRTREMHRISEYGVAAHWRYKEGNPHDLNKTFDDKLSWVRQLLEWHKDMSDTKDFVDAVKTDVFSDEVFVFTPRGDVIDLPQGSIPLDFAYRIHTDVGHRCNGAKVNGKIVPLDYKLSNGDIVEIITSKTGGPSRDWLNIVCASESKNKIRQWLKKESREENISKGREILERETKRLGYETKNFLKLDKLKEIATKMNIPNEDTLLATIGYGEITASAIMTKLIDIYKRDMQKNHSDDAVKQILTELKEKGTKDKTKHNILVKGESGLLVRLAKCCTPVAGDPIVGYITRGRGVSVHTADCVNITNNTDEENRMIEVSWDINHDEDFQVSVNIYVVNVQGIMANCINLVADSKINMFSAGVKVDSDKQHSLITLGLEIRSLEHLEYIINKLRQSKNVLNVYRNTSQDSMKN